MATGYQGYQGAVGYGDPARAQLERKRQIAELLQQGATDTSAKSLPEGIAQLGKAFIASQAQGRADQAESAYGDTVTKRNAASLAALFPDQPPGVDFNPETQDTVQTPAAPNRFRSIAAALLPEMGLAGAIQAGQGAQRQDLEDTRYTDTTTYNRGRDAMGDQWRDKTFDYQVERDQSGDQWRDKTFDYQVDRDKVGDSQWGKSFGLSQAQFDEQKRQALIEQKLASDALKLKQFEANAKAGSGAVFDGPQLATIYNKNMDALDSARNDQGRLDTIASNAQQFVDTAKGYPAESDGFLADIWQFFDPRTGSLNQNTSTIAPLMRQPGSGSSSDKDVAMYQKAGVSVNNTKDGNNRFALASKQMSSRNKQYTDFLNAAINPQDPQSRQKAEQVWNAYKEEVRLFDDKTGAPIEQVMPFRDWYQSKVGAARQPQAAAQPQGGLSPQEAAELAQLRAEMGQR